MKYYPTKNDPQHPPVYYVRDDENGDCIVECGVCGQEFGISNYNRCPGCKSDIYFPAGADW